MTFIVVDAGVLAKTLLVEDGSDDVLAWFARNEDKDFVAPVLAFAETGRVVQKNFAPDLQRDVHTRLMASVRLIDVDDSVWFTTQGLTFYDAHYVHLARIHQCPLATTDERMTQAARSFGIEVVEFSA